ncbi:MAG: septal ring lytic transglycosylase RlpA family protein [Gammaproteobacteria bacterium]|nr:septal ring lytic transglycosylase RlpA family protein [Gammaproteobacteria bacterium]MBV9695951.1 septal ring lytic transglycosylase RlpA family protein [Gammaproteobacteria bacterium]
MRAAALGLLAAAALLAGCSLTPPRAAAPPAPPAAPPGPGATPDAVPRAEPRSAHGNPPFYDVLGHRYYVLPAADGYSERGVASWYGPTFHGGSTSSGEPYDMYGMTAAHKTLPLPTYVRVTNLKNGRSVVVRVNDRGPFVANRLIDLSYSAATKLDMVREGTTLVEVRALTPGVPDELSRSAATPPPPLYVQAGAFAGADNAARLAARLHAAGMADAFVLAPLGSGPRLYRVRLGPVSSVAEFDALSARLAALGIADARLASD